MIYLASPYTHPDSAVREQRYRAACPAMAALLRERRLVFSPIVIGHPLCGHGLPGDWGFWQDLDRAHLERCDEVGLADAGMLEGEHRRAGGGADCAGDGKGGELHGMDLITCVADCHAVHARFETIRRLIRIFG